MFKKIWKFRGMLKQAHGVQFQVCVHELYWQRGLTQLSAQSVLSSERL